MHGYIRFSCSPGRDARRSRSRIYWSSAQSIDDFLPAKSPTTILSSTLPYLMERLPLEVLQPIFGLACVDGGQTGSALSLASRFIRQASHPYRFNAIALSLLLPVYEPTNRVRAFLATYQKYSQPTYGSRPRIRHLYLAFTLDPITGTMVMDYHSLSCSACALFQEVAQDLVSLAIHIAPNDVVQLSWFLRLLDAPLPSLRELTVLNVLDPTLLLFNTDEDDTELEPLFPAVERLHIIQLRNVFSGAESLGLADWMTHAPRTTHLRVSNLQHYSDGFAVQLTSALGVPSEWQQLRTASHPLTNDRLRHPHLRCIVLQLCAPPPDHYEGPVGNAYMTYRRGLVNLSAYPAEGDLGIMLLTPPRNRSTAAWADNAKVAWMKRIGGRAGCWDVVEGTREEIQALREEGVYL
ncbi:hypothetical protein C2E23DRAFT_40106 [Lenzites betulinus]|nr:hypothetical protein C2E23DRAFT_40106 [Lenzites betulinus]